MQASLEQIEVNKRNIDDEVHGIHVKIEEINREIE